MYRIAEQTVVKGVKKADWISANELS